LICFASKKSEHAQQHTSNSKIAHSIKEFALHRPIH